MFELDERLQSDCLDLGQLNLCKVLLLKDANYPWVILVPMRDDIKEIYDLDELDQEQLIWESSFVSKALAKCFDADKMNVAALGNVVSQCHIHHVVRTVDDPAWPNPVWGAVPPRGYTREQLTSRGKEIQQALKTSVFIPANLDN
ncbi:HIT domain-containing protein [Gynuella sunshinyii]|uniref:Diadenosine tetraphosphate (Ap4A) hydrolase and other HIT family hydrolase n=1 Tax=Gynuella sunshinyii YC6258 TaxID=1445510 RepID=A0A0C5VT17_9GAMM|nr:HIT family protein [Gynuella sunshinyii]AJQ96478.1 diadenosine tetraphosphate (Ap4A) hydrolase and other HIT family hydrolase [Gynuella sunshinyii YC6258]